MNWIEARKETFSNLGPHIFECKRRANHWLTSLHQAFLNSATFLILTTSIAEVKTAKPGLRWHRFFLAFALSLMWTVLHFHQKSNHTIQNAIYIPQFALVSADMTNIFTCSTLLASRLANFDRCEPCRQINGTYIYIYKSPKSASSSTFVSILIFLYMQGHRSHGGQPCALCIIKRDLISLQFVILTFQLILSP